FRVSRDRERERAVRASTRISRRVFVLIIRVTAAARRVALKLALPFENDLATHHSHYASRRENFRLRNLHNVLGENSEISQLSGFDRALVLLLERGVSGPGCKHLQRLLSRKGLFGMPSFTGKSFHALARHRCVELDH